MFTDEKTKLDRFGKKDIEFPVIKIPDKKLPNGKLPRSLR